MITIEDIKKLRDETGVSPVEIKKALDQASGDVEKAKELLQAWGKKIVDKKITTSTIKWILVEPANCN